MLIFENMRLALSSLYSNKMRSVLTMLGIIIGIASVIAIMTLGDSLTNSVTSSMSSMGVNNITLGIQQKTTEDEVGSGGAVFAGGTQGGEMTEDDYITYEMLAALEEEFPDQIKTFSASEHVGSSSVKIGSLYANVDLTGASAGYFVANELTLLAGNYIGEVEYTNAKEVALVSDKLVDNLYGGDLDKAIGNEIQIPVNEKIYTLIIIGVYEYEASGFSMTSDQDVTTSVYIPLRLAKNYTHTENYSQVTVVTADGVDATSFAAELEAFLDVYYMRNEKFEPSAFSLASMAESMTSMLSTVTIAIAVIAGIALLVGGIGVMNIMLVSITERTREIGTRKALGATNGSIRIQFIIEAIFLCLTGGIIGIILGVVMGMAGASLLGYPASPSVASIALAMGFSMAIGVFFGYYPANKAAKMDPIEALRYE